MSQSLDDIADALQTDMEINGPKVGELVNCACTTFPDMNDRMRFMALVVFTAASSKMNVTNHELMNIIPNAMGEVAKAHLDETEPGHHTVH